MSASLAHSAGRIVPLAWPVFIGQLSVVAFGTIDTLLVARHSSGELAALAVGGACYFTIFIGFMGVLIALSPIVGRLLGAGQHAAAGAQLHQAVWLALLLSVPGCGLLLFPGPLVALAHLNPQLDAVVRSYLASLALALPASLLFTVFRAFNTAVSRPKAVMLIQLAALLVKAPLSLLLLQGVPGLGWPALGVIGCSLATVCVMWLQLALAVVLLRRDPFYARFAIFDVSFDKLRRGLRPPDPAALRALLALGLPIGLSTVIEVSGFTFMAVFIARLGVIPVAGHQLTANVMAMLFMLPLALSNATSALVAQHVGARELHVAQRLGWHGMALAIGLATLCGVAVVLVRGPLVGLYTSDAAVAAAAMPLMAWLALFHICDAAQTMAAFVLRSWYVATVPTLIYAAALGGVGLGGGYLLAFDVLGHTPAWLQGAPGYWAAGTAGLALAALALSALWWWVLRQRMHEGWTERQRP